MYRAAARRVCRCHGMDRDEAQQPPPTCGLPHLATATGAAGCAPSGVALHLGEHQGCRRRAQVFGDANPVVRDRHPQERGQTRLGLLADVGRYRRRCWRSGPTGARRGIGDGGRPLTARPYSFCCFTWINGVDLRYGSTADQGRTGREDSSSRLWRPARALGTHAKRGPSTGHSAVGLRQGGEISPDAEATFHCAIMHAW